MHLTSVKAMAKLEKIGGGALALWWVHKIELLGCKYGKILSTTTVFFHFLRGALAPSNDYVASPLKGLMCFRISPTYEVMPSIQILEILMMLTTCKIVKCIFLRL